LTADVQGLHRISNQPHCAFRHHAPERDADDASAQAEKQRFGQKGVGYDASCGAERA